MSGTKSTPEGIVAARWASGPATGKSRLAT